MKTNHFEEALTDLTRANELKPNNARLLSQRSQVLKELRRYEEALTDLKRAIELNESDNQR